MDIRHWWVPFTPCQQKCFLIAGYFVRNGHAQACLTAVKAGCSSWLETTDQKHLPDEALAFFGRQIDLSE